VSEVSDGKIEALQYFSSSPPIGHICDRPNPLSCEYLGIKTAGVKQIIHIPLILKLKRGRNLTYSLRFFFTLLLVGKGATLINFISEEYYLLGYNVM
jgi:hypothetical protein